MTFMNENEGVRDRVIRILAGIASGYAAWMSWPGTASLMSRQSRSLAGNWFVRYLQPALSTRSR